MVLEPRYATLDRKLSQNYTFRRGKCSRWRPLKKLRSKPKKRICSEMCISSIPGPLAHILVSYSNRYLNKGVNFWVVNMCVWRNKNWIQENEKLAEGADKKKPQKDPVLYTETMWKLGTKYESHGKVMQTLSSRAALLPHQFVLRIILHKQVTDHKTYCFKEHAESYFLLTTDEP